MQKNLSDRATTKCIEPTKKLLRLSNNMSQIPKDMMELLYVKLVGELKRRSKWQYLSGIKINRIAERDAYFRQYGKKTNKQVVYGFFTITNRCIFVPSQLNAKALVIGYTTKKAVNEYKQLLKEQEENK